MSQMNKQVFIPVISNWYTFRERNELAGENLRWLEKVFQRTVGDHGEITLNDFKTIVQSKNVSIMGSIEPKIKKVFFFSEVSKFCSVENAVEELVFYLVAVILNEIVSQIWIVKFILKLDLFQIYFKQIWHSSMNSNLIRHNVLTWNGLRSLQNKSNLIR